MERHLIEGWVVWCLLPLLVLLYCWGISTYGYFERRNVPFLRPVPFFGHVLSFLTSDDTAANVKSVSYKHFPDSRVSGTFTFRTPSYLIHDPLLFKQMAIKDFDHFVDHSTSISLEHDPLFARSLFFSRGTAWRNRRSDLTPAFTGSKIRNMFVLLSNRMEKAMEHMLSLAGGKPIEMDAQDLFGRIGSDMMTSISLGVEVDSLSDPDNLFYLYGNRLAKIDGKQGFRLILWVLYPQLMNFLRVGIVSKDVNEFFLKHVSQNIRYRLENDFVRPDFIHLLLQGRRSELQSETSKDCKENSTEVWNDIDIAAFAASFLFGGIESTPTVVSFAIYEMAVNVDIQDRLRAEIDEVRNKLQGAPPTYEVLQQMRYLDMIVHECLRRWTPLPMTNRRCTKDFSFTNNDGTVILIEKGTEVYLPIQAIHLDHRYFPDPLRFDPERFADTHNVHSDYFLPFGCGIRSCIGLRLALTQAKAMLFYILSNFTVALGPRMQLPIKLKSKTSGTKVTGGIWINFIPRGQSKEL